jgi:hypothetical protein
MSFFKRVLNLGKGMASTMTSDRETRLREEALEAELSRPTPVSKGSAKAEAATAPLAADVPHPASDPLARPPAKRTL